MSDTENPDRREESDPSGEVPQPPVVPAAPQVPEPTRAYDFAPPTVPSTPYAAPTLPDAYAAPQPYGTPVGYEPTVLVPPMTQTEDAPVAEHRRVPGWTWPLVSVLALVLGLVGGLVGGALVSDDDAGAGSGGILEVQTRKAAPLPADNSSVAAVASKVLPSTVQIIAEYKGEEQGATGSGWVFDDKGHIITNNHVVEEAAADDGPIEVIDQENRRYKATVVGLSKVYDVAVLKIDSDDLEPIAWGSSEQMHVGETVVAFGSPLGLTATVTAGIISAVHRPVTTGDGDDSSYINAVQTDAAINPGNSGGPLVNLQGQVIGVNSAIASLGSVSNDEGGNIGVGFAIPIEQVLVTADQILKTGKALYPIIGANVRGTRTLDGATVESITSGGPASKSDLKVGDVIMKVDDQPVTGSSDVVVAVRSHRPTDTITLTVRRDGKTLEIKVGLEAKVG